MNTNQPLSSDEKKALCIKALETWFYANQQPITVQQFADYFADAHPAVYAPTVCTNVFRTLANVGAAREVYRKEGPSIPRLYIPVSADPLSIPYDKRDWETEKENKERKQQVFEKVTEKSEDDRQFFLTMIGSPHAQKKATVKRPIATSLRKRDEDYKRFLSIIKPYVSLLDEKRKGVLSSYLGINGDTPKSMREVATEHGVTAMYVSTLVRESFYRIDRLMREAMCTAHDMKTEQ